jgi:hypothetical protein
MQDDLLYRRFIADAPRRFRLTALRLQHRPQARPPPD